MPDPGIMKTFAILSIVLLPLALGIAAPRAERVDYAGYKNLRITLAEDASDILGQIEENAAHILNPGQQKYIDVVVAADKVNAIGSLGLDVEVLAEDVGAALAQEGNLVSTYAGEAARDSESLGARKEG